MDFWMALGSRKNIKDIRIKKQSAGHPCPALSNNLSLTTNSKDANIQQKYPQPHA